MKRTILSIAVALTALIAAAVTKPGIETLRDSGFAQLNGKRVGLITNPTGVDNNLKSTVDILHEADGVNLVALFGPEHGVRGDVHAGDTVGNSVDAATGVKVYSLYGKTYKPTKEMLKDIDVLIYDIQDNGCRSYTFISTMGVAMEACAENNVEFMVLDRPNPVSGTKVEGCLVEDEWISFVSKFKIPYLYGLTPGELAMLLNEEGMLPGGKKCRLTVIPMKGWTRDMTFEQTGMPWVLPSPHVPQAVSSLYYPATGILGELGYVNIGVGYTLPFQMIAAEWINAEELSRALNDLHLPGLRFRPIHVKPFYSVGKGENLQGVQIYITNKDAANLSLVQFYVMQEMARLYPEHKTFDHANQKRYNMFDKVSGSNYIREEFSKRHRVEDIIEYWNKDVDAFKRLSSKYYIY
ncbi:MAG: exo-beta-N-acetylmuramidase NamZ domain-containing protein [Muribaculaceae bacterium]